MKLTSSALVFALAVVCADANAQSQGNDAIVGEKGLGQSGDQGAEAIVGEKRNGQTRTPGGQAIVGEKGRTRPGAMAATLPPDIRNLMLQPGPAVRFRPAALKLQQLPADVLASRPAPSDLGAPFRIEPAAVPASPRRWYASRSDFASGMDSVSLAHDPRAPRLDGRFGLVFPVQPGYRYIVDCAVARASEFAVSHTGLGQSADGARVLANSGLVSVVSPPVREAGNAWIELKAVRAQSAAWEWRGCEITPLRAG